MRHLTHPYRLLRLLVAAVVTSAAMLMAFAGPSMATPPVKVVVEDPDWPGYSFYYCGFQATYRAEIRDVTLTFFDSEGNVVRVQKQVFTRNQVWTNPQTGAVLTSSGGVYTFVYNVGDAFATFSGKTVVITVGGSGVVFQDAGRIAVSGFEPPWDFPFVAGRHDFWLQPDRLCPYLDD